MKLYKHIIIFFIAIMMFMIPSCNPKYVAPPRPTPIVTDTNYCKAAQEHLIELSCPVAKPTKKGVVFEEFCKQTQQAGIFINPKCLSEVNTCDEVDDCTYSREPK